jgi:hypothetical protein
VMYQFLCQEGGRGTSPVSSRKEVPHVAECDGQECALSMSDHQEADAL